MPRALTTRLRRALEEPRSSEYVVIFLEIRHETLAEPIRVANDVVSYEYNDDTYLGFPFELEIVGDSTQVPRGRIKIQNVDEQIGKAVLNLVTPPIVKIMMFTSSDFASVLVDNKRYPVGVPVVEYQADYLAFGSISVDAQAITGEIKSFEMSNEPWPATRSTADRLPGIDP